MLRRSIPWILQSTPYPHNTMTKLPTNLEGRLSKQDGESSISPEWPATLDPETLNMKFADLNSKQQKSRRLQIQAIIDRVPLVVFADDNEVIHRVALRTLAQFRSAGRDCLVPLQAPLPEAFQQADKVEQGKLPVIQCINGFQAEEAAQILAGRDSEAFGIIAFDQNMEKGPLGIDIFRKYHEFLPPRMIRILQSGAPGDVRMDLSKGIIDASTDKIGNDSIATIAKTFAERFQNKGLSGETSYTKEGNEPFSD